MSEYDADSLQSVLTYMRERFGEGIFEEPPRMYATMNDLSPKMKGARNILRHLSEAGLCAELRAAIRSGQDNECLRILTKSRYWLMNNLDLSENRAEYYVTALKVAYGLETPSQPQMPPEPTPKIISAPNPAPPKPIPQQKPISQPPKPIQQPKPTPQPSPPQPKSKPTSKPMFAALRSLFASVLKPQSKLAPIIKLGSSGDCTWTLDGNGTFTISGNGAMENYSSLRDSPWQNDSNGIYSVIIEHGVTNIGGCAFKNCSNLISVSIPDSVTDIGWNAFRYCSSLTNISIPDSVTSIQVQAFLVAIV